MTGPERPALVLSIDDDAEIRDLVSQVLGVAGYRVVTAADGPSGLRAAREHRPGLILLDIMMPGMNGYRVCDDLQADPRTADIPVIFLTALDDEQDRARALSLGGTEYLVKPFHPSAVLEAVRRNLSTGERFGLIGEASRAAGRRRVVGSDFMRFKSHLLETLPHRERIQAVVERMMPGDMFAKAASAGIDASELASIAATFLALEWTASVDPATIDLGVLPAPYCRSNLVVPVVTPSGRAFVVANPFDLELQEVLTSYSGSEELPRIIVAEPRTILCVLGAVRPVPSGQRAAEPARPPAAPAPVAAPEPPANAERRLEILVVDDDPDAQHLVCRLVSAAGHSVTAVSEGASALVALTRQPFDLVLADIEMPTLGGFALLDIMRRQEIRVPVVFVTGHTTPEDEAAAKRLGGAGFVPKPIDREALLEAIARVVARGPA